MHLLFYQLLFRSVERKSSKIPLESVCRLGTVCCGKFSVDFTTWDKYAVLLSWWINRGTVILYVHRVCIDDFPNSYVQFFKSKPHCQRWEYMFYFFRIVDFLKIWYGQRWESVLSTPKIYIAKCIQSLAEALSSRYTKKSLRHVIQVQCWYVYKNVGQEWIHYKIK